MTPDASTLISAHHPAIFEPEAFFTGTLACSGMFIDRFGHVRRRFVADIRCEPQDNGFRLYEHFLFDDGEAEDRVWHIKRQTDALYHGECADLDGRAVGVLEGPALRWRYQFNLDIGSRKIKVSFDDLMVQQSATVVLNRAKVRKFGILLGELFITFQRTPPLTAQAAE